MSLLRRRAMMAGESHTRLEYLEFKDMAYIDTGYIPGDNTAFEFEAAFNTGAQCWYGSISAISGSGGFERFHGGVESASGRICIYINSGTNAGAIQKSNDVGFHTYYISESLCRLDEIESSADLSIPDLTLYVGTRNSVGVNSSISYTMNRCRYAKIYENGELVRHYIPVLKNGTYCMYEQIQGKYYYNAAGVGYFTGG